MYKMLLELENLREGVEEVIYHHDIQLLVILLHPSGPNTQCRMDLDFA